MGNHSKWTRRPLAAATSAASAAPQLTEVDRANAIMLAAVDSVPPAGMSLDSAPTPQKKDGDGWLYHRTEPPRIFQDQEEIPDGWNIENRKSWTVTDHGEFVNVSGQ